jgi:large subunit ribosomal protein L15
MPLIRRVPKRGFTNPFRVPNQVVNLKDLDKISTEEVNPAALVEAGLAGNANRPIKILGTGAARRAYVVQGCTTSRTAREKIEQAGGRVES